MSLGLTCVECGEVIGIGMLRCDECVAQLALESSEDWDEAAEYDAEFDYDEDVDDDFPMYLEYNDYDDFASYYDEYY